MSLGLGLSRKAGIVSSYVRDGLKLYMPYNSPKEVKFVGEGSIYFDGSNDYVDLNSDFETTLLNSSFSVSMWVKPDDGIPAATEYLIGTKSGSEDNFWVRIDVSTGKIQFYYIAHSGNESICLSDAYFADGQSDWVHIACTLSNTEQKIYANGILIKTTTNSIDTSTFDQATARNIVLGARNDEGTIDDHFAGYMKNVGFWSRVLSATEVQNVMYKTYTDLSGTLSSGLVSWWALESSTDTYADSTGTNDGTNSGSTVNSSLYGGHTPLIPRGFDNAPTVQADAIGTGYAVFDATGEVITMGDNVGDFGTADFSMCCWVKSTTLTRYDRMLSKREANSDIGWSLFVDNGTGTGDVIKFVMEQDNGLITALATANGTFTQGKWYHVAIVADRTSAEKNYLYLDGILTATDSDTSAIGSISSAAQFSIGAGIEHDDDAVVSGWTGYIKNVGVWTGTLTQAQIQSIMEKTYSELIASEKTNLVSWWGLDSYLGDNTHADGKMIQDEHNTTLGSEIIDADSQSGTITDSSTPWVSDGDGSEDEAQQATISSGTITWTSVGDWEALSYTGTPVAGTTYKCVLTVSLTSGSLNVYSDRSTDLAHLGISSSGTYTAYIIHEQTDWMVRFASNSFIGTISDISLKVVTDANTGQLK